MSTGSAWTDEIVNETSFLINRIDDLPPKKGNFHNYNHKVIYMYIIKNRQGQYKYKTVSYTHLTLPTKRIV